MKYSQQCYYVSTVVNGNDQHKQRKQNVFSSFFCVSYVYIFKWLSLPQYYYAACH